MRNVLRFVAVLMLVLCVAGADAGQKEAGRVESKSVTAPILMPNEPHAGTVIFSEGFNDTVPSHFPPTGWIFVNRDGSASDVDVWWASMNIGLNASPIPPYEGLAFAANDYYAANDLNIIDDYLITPNTGGSAPAGAIDSLVFYLASRRSASGNYPDSLDIRVSTTGKDTANFTQRLAYVLAPKSVWTRFAYQLPIATNRYIAFRYLIYDGGSAGSNSDKIGVDAVQIIRYTSTGVTNRGSDVPTAYALQQNYPNPFNPSTQIAFALPSAGQVTLRVFDALGREISTLVNNEELSAGNHSRSFDATGLAGGVYFYRLTAGSYTAVRQMVLVK